MFDVIESGSTWSRPLREMFLYIGQIDVISHEKGNAELARVLAYSF
jgi:hypothetical protein